MIGSLAKITGCRLPQIFLLQIIFCGDFLKGKVYMNTPQTLEDLRRNITAEIDHITPDMLKKFMLIWLNKHERVLRLMKNILNIYCNILDTNCYHFHKYKFNFNIRIFIFSVSWTSLVAVVPDTQLHTFLQSTVGAVTPKMFNSMFLSSGPIIDDVKNLRNLF